MSKKQKSSKRTQSAHRAENRNRSWARGEERHRINRQTQIRREGANKFTIREGYGLADALRTQKPSKMLRLLKREEQRMRDA